MAISLGGRGWTPCRASGGGFDSTQWRLKPGGSLRYLIEGSERSLNAIAQLRLTAGGRGVPGPASIDQGVLRIPGARVCSKQRVKVGWRVIVLRGKGLLELLDGLGVLPSIGKNAADMKVRETIIRPPVDGLLEISQSFVQLALPFQHHSQVVVSLSMNRIGLQGTPEGLLRLRPLSLPHQEHTVIV